MQALDNTKARNHWRRAFLRWAAVVLVIGSAAMPRSAASAEPLTASGLIIPYRRAKLASTSDGVIAEVLVQEGDKVTQGQVLARLEATRESLEAEYAKTVMDKRAADLAAARMLFGEDILSKEQWTEKEADAKLSQTQFRLAEQKLAEKEIRAPYSGVIVRRFKEQGESIRNLEHFAEIVNLDKFYAEVYFEAGAILRVRRGQPAEVSLPVYGDTVFPGVVEIVDPVIDPASGLFRVRILCENPRNSVCSGTTAHVRLSESAPGAPTEAPAPPAGR